MWKALIASDVDGTLLQEGAKALPEELFTLIRSGLAHDIQFVAASGRDYASLTSLFAPVKDEIYFISTNGGQLFHKDRLLLEYSVPKTTVADLAAAIEAAPGLEVLVSTSTASLMKPHNHGFHKAIAGLGNRVMLIDSFLDIDEPIMKVSAYCPEGALAQYERFADEWGESFKITVAGDTWLDFNAADKGGTLAHLSNSLGLEAGQVYAFGDQYNDLSMLDYAGQPFLMGHAAEALRRRGYPLTAYVPDEIRRILQAHGVDELGVRAV